MNIYEQLNNQKTNRNKTYIHIDEQYLQVGTYFDAGIVGNEELPTNIIPNRRRIKLVIISKKDLFID